MDDKVVSQFVYILRSMYFYGKNGQQYTEQTFASWVANHKTQEDEIKKAYTNFSFATIPQVTFFYFKYIFLLL